MLFQGDILAGTVGTFLAWNRILQGNDSNSGSRKKQSDDVVLASWMACCFTKQSTSRAFKKRKRSMTAPDILEEIGAVIDDYTSTTIDSA
jgi:ATP-dependent NAD(P)H-hydrate dehydratase